MMTTTTTAKRQRADGTWTMTTEAYDAIWYWPVGTRVRVTIAGQLFAGVVVKENSTTVRVAFDDGVEHLRNGLVAKRHPALARA
jgi:hypothetical protein